MRNFAALMLSVLCVLGAAHDASAQSCHAPMLVAPQGLGLRVALETTAATFDNARGKGNYQGLATTLTWSFDPVQLYVRAPWWRVERDGSSANGFGDLATAARFRVWQSASEFMRVGLAAAASIPTGDQAKDLGMGHVMLTPGAFFALYDDVYTAELLLSYATALMHDESTHTEGLGLSPIVSPMNPQELQAALGVVRRVHALISLVAGGFVAVPVGEQMHGATTHAHAEMSTDGRTRAFANVGLRFHHAWFDSSLEGALPLAGDPFDVRGTWTFGASF